MNFIKKALDFIIEDLKTDYLAIKKLSTGDYDKQKLKNHLVQVKKNMWQGAKTFWIFFIIIILAWVLGFYVGSQHYEADCNRYIHEEIIPQCKNIALYQENNTSQYLDLFVFNNSG